MIPSSFFSPLGANITASQDSYELTSTSKSYQENLTLASSTASGTGREIDNAINRPCRKPWNWVF